MRRAAKWFGWIVAVLVGLPLLLVAAVLVAANTGPGRHAIEALTPRLTGDTVRLSGLSGRFPDALRVARIQLRDPHGDYARVDNAVLDWSPLQVLRWRIVIDRLAAGEINVMRTPASSSSSSSSFGLPAPVTLRHLNVARLEIGAAIAGSPAALTVNGSGEATSPTDFQAKLDIHQFGGAGEYTLTASGSQTELHAILHASEPAHGLVAELAGLPDVGGLSLDAAVQGPRSAVATRVSLAAGPLHATVGGTIDLDHDTVELNVSAMAPAMRPRPDISWQAVTLDAQLRGPFTAPDAAGRLKIEQLAASGATASSVTADIAGNAGQLHLDGQVAELRVPLPNPAILAGEPVLIHADARLDQPDRPVHVTVRHKLFTLDANALTGAKRSVDATLTAPDLSPFAAMDKVDVAGGMTLSLHATTQGTTTTLAADGTVGVTGGMQQARGLVGDNGRLRLAATLHGSDLTLSDLQFTGQSLSLSAKGSLAQNQVDLNWSLGVADLAAADASLQGALQATGKVSGTTDNLDLTSDINGSVATHGLSSGGLAAHITVNGLPNNPSGMITAQGSLLDAPVDLAVAMQRTSDGFAVDIQRASWKSLQAGGTLQMPTSTMVPAGNLHIALTRMADLAPLVGRPLAGSLDAALNATADKLHLTLRVDGAALAGTAAASRIALSADVDQPQSHPVLNAQLDASGIQANGITGSLRATANGPEDAVAVKLSASTPELSGSPGQLSAAATIDGVARTVSVASLQGEWHKEAIRLLAPVRVSFANGVAVDRLRIGLRQAVLDVSGRIGSTLDLTASFHGPADIGAAVSPAYALGGALTADARITGSASHPTGRVHLAANGLRAQSGPARAAPPANITATATLDGTNAQIDARIVAGQSHLALAGSAPMATTGSLRLKATGTVNLGLANPILTASGRRVSGEMTLDLDISGAVTAPSVAGNVQLANGDVQDFTTGVHLTDIAARIQGSGGTLRITQFSAKAGPGTMDMGGTIGVMQPGLPLDLTITANNARPLASDMISATINANLTIRGEAETQLAVGGVVNVQRAEFRIPERLPTAIAVLPVSQPGQKPPPPATASSIALNLTVDAPEQVFVRGRGLDTEFGGSMRITGTATAPVTVGALHLRRGSLSLGGHTLDFTDGTIAFNGGSLTDPSLNLVATSSTENVTATLTIGGTAQKPTITLSSVPPLPQDEVLAHLLFGSGIGKLGALEVAEIATGLATLTGTGGSIGDPLNSVRQGLGLDRLSVANGSNGSPTLQAGRYIAPGVYLGAQQSASGGGTQATVQVDIAKGLKLQGTAGTSGGSATGAAGQSEGSGIGLTYQFQY